jgi:hypothetical protein
MDDDPWHWLNFRYENDDIARFELVLDAIEDVVKQARSSTVASLRMGLITADYAADVLLARRVARIMALSEEGPFFEPRKRFDSRARSLLRQGFNRRVAVGANDYSRRFTFGLGTPILDKSDAEVLRVAHAYRNDVYHEDRHNEDTLLAIVTATVHTVARMWPRSLSSKVGTSQGANGPVVRRLRKKGYEGTDWGGPNTWCLHDGARAVAQWLECELPMHIDEIQHAVAVDIAKRVARTDSMVAWLGGSEGPGVDQIEPGLHWNEFWRRHGDDPEFVRVSEARSVAWEHVTDERSEQIDAAARATDDAYNECFRTLMGDFSPP